MPAPNAPSSFATSVLGWKIRRKHQGRWFSFVAPWFSDGSQEGEIVAAWMQFNKDIQDNVLMISAVSTRGETITLMFNEVLAEPPPARGK